MQAFYLAAFQVFFFPAMNGNPLAIAFRFAPSEVFFNAYDGSAANVLLDRAVLIAKLTFLINQNTGAIRHDSASVEGHGLGCETGQSRSNNIRPYEFANA